MKILKITFPYFLISKFCSLNTVFLSCSIIKHPFFLISFFEKDLANMNYNIENSIETVFLMTPPNLSHISSSLVREIIQNNGDIQNFVPKEINQLFLGNKKRT